MDSTRTEIAIQTTSMSLKQLAEDFQVINNDTYTQANEIGRALKAARKQVDDFMDPIVESAHKAHKTALAKKKELAAPLEEAQAVIDRKQVTWYKAEQARIRAEQERALEEARRKAEEEALATAQALQDAGLHEAAEEALDAPVILKGIVTPVMERAEGTSYREIWSAEVVDLMTLVSAVAAGQAPIAYLMPNTAALNATARAMKGAVKIPGVMFKAETSIARRTA